MGRATQGVTLIGLDDGSRLSGLQRIVENDANGEANGEANGDTNGDVNGDKPAGAAADVGNATPDGTSGQAPETGAPGTDGGSDTNEDK